MGHVMKSLTEAEIVAVSKELLKGFSAEYQLAHLIATAADLSLANDIGAGLPLSDTAARIIKATEDRGVTELLLREAALQRPHNKTIQALAARYGLAATVSSVSVLLQDGGLVRAAPAERDTYEAVLLTMAGSAKPGDWRRRMADREAAVCQILFRGDAIGTGFLVATDCVMSNWHVFESAPGSGKLAALEDYSVRFDYRAAEGEAPASSGTTAAIDAQAGYLAKSDKTVLDYVLVKLTTPAGEDVVGAAGQKRGWLKPSSRTLQALEPVLVLQHPKGRTLELAIGPVTGWVENRTNKIYLHWANTDEGSSGSPCFTAQWELAALHHRADPAGGSRANRAIAMPAILADLDPSLLPEVD